MDDDDDDTRCPRCKAECQFDRSKSIRCKQCGFSIPPSQGLGPQVPEYGSWRNSKPHDFSGKSAFGPIQTSSPSGKRKRPRASTFESTGSSSSYGNSKRTRASASVLARQNPGDRALGVTPALSRVLSSSTSVPWGLVSKGRQHDFRDYPEFSFNADGTDVAPRIIFPGLEDLAHSIGELADRLQTEFSELTVGNTSYGHLMRTYAKTPTEFTQSILQLIDPEFKELCKKSPREREITPNYLASVSLRQQGTPTSPDTGYLFSVTDDRNDKYLRSYVGQSSDTRGRIVRSHIPNILTGKTNSLAYFIVFKGNCHRSVRFLRLWQIPETPYPLSPQNVAERPYRHLQRNVLECLFCLAFRSLPSRTLNSLFGEKIAATEPTIGLNILSPIYQSAWTGSAIIEQAIKDLYAVPSPDPEIEEYQHFRLERKKREKQTTKAPRDFVKELVTIEEIEKALYNSCDDSDLVETWLQHARSLRELRAYETPLKASFTSCTDAASVLTSGLYSPPFTLPMGSLSADISIVLDPINEFKLSESNSPNELQLPFGIRESNFHPQRTLVWTWNHRDYPHSPNVIPDTPKETLVHMHRALIAASELKLLFLWGPVAADILDTAFDTRQFRLQIRNCSCNASFTLEKGHSKAGIPLLMIELPVVPWGLHSFHNSGIYKMVNIYKVAMLLGSGPRPTHLENQLAIRSIMILRREQVASPDPQKKLQISSIPLGLRYWLARKGFSTTAQLESLTEATNGDLTLGLIGIIGVLAARTWAPRRARGPTGPGPKKVRKHLPTDVFERVRQLCDKLNPRLLQTESIQDKTESVTLPTASCQAETSLISVLNNGTLEGSETADVLYYSRGTQGALGSMGAQSDTPYPSLVSAIEQYGGDLLEDIEGHFSGSNQQSEPSVTTGLNAILNDLGTAVDPDPTLVLEDHIWRRAQQQQSHFIRNWTSERDPEFRGKSYPCSVPLNRERAYVTFGHLRMNLGYFCENLGNGKCNFFIHACDRTKRHSQVFAKSSLDTDPGKSIAINVVSAEDNPVEFNFWPQDENINSVFGANVLADQILEGLSSEESRKRERRTKGKKEDSGSVNVI